MALYLKQAIFVNRAPFEHIELNFKKDGANVLSAINGKGKTTILSHIVDAFYELAITSHHHSSINNIKSWTRLTPQMPSGQMTPPQVNMRLRVAKRMGKMKYELEFN